jgi:hypothetical protein
VLLLLLLSGPRGQVCVVHQVLLDLRKSNHRLRAGARHRCRGPLRRLLEAVRRHRARAGAVEGWSRDDGGPGLERDALRLRRGVLCLAGVGGEPARRGRAGLKHCRGAGRVRVVVNESGHSRGGRSGLQPVGRGCRCCCV